MNELTEGCEIVAMTKYQIRPLENAVTSLDAEEDSVERGFRVKVIGLTQESLHFMHGIRNLENQRP